MEAVLAALGQPDRLGIVLWLIEHGPARQVELLQVLERNRNTTVNPGTAATLIRPLIDAGVLVRDRPRGPLYLRDRERTIDVLKAAAAISADSADSGKKRAEAVFDELRRAIVQDVHDGQVTR